MDAWLVSVICEVLLVDVEDPELVESVELDPFEILELDFAVDTAEVDVVFWEEVEAAFVEVEVANFVNDKVLAESRSP